MRAAALGILRAAALGVLRAAARGAEAHVLDREAKEAGEAQRGDARRARLQRAPVALRTHVDAEHRLHVGRRLLGAGRGEAGRQPVPVGGLGGVEPGQRRREVQLGNPRMCELRAQDDAFQLSVVTDIDGVFRKPSHLLPRFDAWRHDIVAVKAARACLGHGAEDAVIRAAAAQMT